jgi:MoaA/NifB/PqqE/SkfB family radical SAM enzyme
MPVNRNDFLNKLAYKTISIVPRQFGDARYVISYSFGMVKYLTPSKAANLLRREYERLKRVSLPKGFPFHAVVDVSNACNLECPYCPTGRRQTSGRKERIIDVDLVKTFLDRYGKYLIAADLFNWGESLLHPQISDIVNLFHERRIFHQISSNLNIKNRSVLEKICDAGLDILIVSISGTTQEIYERYHRRGDIFLVVENLKHLIDYRKKMHLFSPIIELKYLTFKYNAHQVLEAFHLAKEIGVDIFRSHIAGGPEEEIIQIDEENKKILYDGTGQLCYQLWRTIVLNSDGGIAPCCLLYFKDDDFAHISNVEETSQRYIEARNMFNKLAVGELDSHLQHPCLKCSFVHRQKHLAEYLAANPYAKRGHRTGGP